MSTHDVDTRSSEAETLVAPRRHSNSTSLIEEGTVLGSYKIITEIGSGGVGRVYLAEHTILGRRVALKMLRSELCHDPKLVSRFFAEARSVNEIAHENIVTITDFIVGEGHPSYYIMELLEGVPLDLLLKDQGALPGELAIDIALQLTSALAAAHEKDVVHRDLKPANVFLVPRMSGGYHVRLLDFGVAKFARGDESSEEGSLIGTPDYMSPEQTFGMEVDHRADIYALGVVLFEMATGVRPFDRQLLTEILLAHRMAPVPMPRQIAPRPVSAELERIILACMEKLPDDRPQSMAELRERLLGAQVQKKPRGRSMMWLSAIAAAGFGAAAFFFTPSPPEPNTKIVVLPPAPLVAAPAVPPVVPDPLPLEPRVEEPEAEPAPAKVSKSKKRKRSRRSIPRSEIKSPETKDKKIDTSLTKDPFD